jgi:polar amino acid transport system substrate-binding protein
MKKTRYGLLLVFLVAILTLAGCADGGSEETAMEQEPASLLDEIVERGTIRVGMSTFVPWAMQSKDGELIGFEIDVARRLAADMGVEIEFVPTQWSGIIPALLTGRFDVIIGGMSIKPDRNLRVNFTIPYDYSGIAIAANAQNVPGRTTLEEFDTPDTVIAARLGTTAASAAERFLPNAEIRLFEQETQAVQEALNGSADAIVASAPFRRISSWTTPTRSICRFPTRLRKSRSGLPSERVTWTPSTTSTTGFASSNPRDGLPSGSSTGLARVTGRIRSSR